jgi:glucose/arabinose dehydrogenase
MQPRGIVLDSKFIQSCKSLATVKEIYTADLHSDTQYGGPVGLAIANDGSLLIGDDDGGVTYRVSYSSGPITNRR